MKKPVSHKNRTSLKKGKLTVGYLLAGYPDRDHFIEVLAESENAGLDIFEIGYPSEHPALDGDVIRRSHASADLSVRTDLDYWRKIRNTVKAPVWIMAYKADLIDSGFYRTLAKNGLVDAIVIPDATQECRLALLAELEPLCIDVLGFVTPEMNEKDQEYCFRNFPLIYQQLYSGPTGIPVETSGYGDILDRARKHEGLNVFAGFGIQSADRVSQLLESGFDGVIVGTAMISKLNQSKEALVAFIKELKKR